MQIEDLLLFAIFAFVVLLIAMNVIEPLASIVNDARGNSSINCKTHPEYDSGLETDDLACAITGITIGVYITLILAALWGSIKGARYLARPQEVY